MKKIKGYYSVKKYLLCMLAAVFTLVCLAPPAAVKAASATATEPDYSLVFDSDYYYDKYEDLQKAYGRNPFHLFNHFLTLGMREGRQAISSFNVYDYAANNLDLITRFGTSDLSKYYMHYITEGYLEGRSCKSSWSTSSGSGNGTTDDDTLSGYADSLVDMINQARTSIDVNALGYTSDLGAAANARATEVISNYSHTRPNGTNYTSVLDAYGIKYSGSYEVVSSGFANPSDVMYSWTRDSEISGNLTDKKFKHIGVGCAADSTGKIYWVLLLTYK